MPRRHEYRVYIVTNRTKTLYTGVTNDIMRGMYEHRNSLFPGFTSKYRIDRLVYFERRRRTSSTRSRGKRRSRGRAAPRRSPSSKRGTRSGRTSSRNGTPPGQVPRRSAPRN